MWLRWCCTRKNVSWEPNKNKSQEELSQEKKMWKKRNETKTCQIIQQKQNLQVSMIPTKLFGKSLLDLFCANPKSLRGRKQRVFYCVNTTEQWTFWHSNKYSLISKRTQILRSIICFAWTFNWWRNRLTTTIKRTKKKKTTKRIGKTKRKMSQQIVQRNSISAAYVNICIELHSK